MDFSAMLLYSYFYDVFKIDNLIELRTAMIMCKANTGCLPVNRQTMFDLSLERIHDARNISDSCLHSRSKS